MQTRSKKEKEAVIVGEDGKVKLSVNGVVFADPKSLIKLNDEDKNKMQDKIKAAQEQMNQWMSLLQAADVKEGKEKRETRKKK